MLPLLTLEVSSSSVWVAVIVCLIYTAWRCLKHYLESKRPFDGALPSPPDSHWLLGHIPKFRGESPAFLQHLMEEHANEDGLTALYLGPKVAVSVLQWQDARILLHAETQRQTVAVVRRHVVQFLGPRNIGVLNGRDWKYQRAAILRAFRPTAILTESTQQAMVQVTQILIQSLLARPESYLSSVDVESLMKMITMDVFGQTALTYDMGCCAKLESSPLAAAFGFLGTELSRRFNSPLGLAENMYSLPTPANRRFREEKQRLRSFLARLIETRQSEPEPKKEDLLTSLIRANVELEAQQQPQQSGGLTDETLSDVLMALLFAGYDTTSMTLTYALYNLATHPHAEALCLEEIQRVWNNDDGTNHHNHEDLVYCRAVILETLRLYPPAVFVSRNLSKPLQLSSGFTIPGDSTTVYVPIWLIQRMAQNFPRPLEFHPERWATRKKGAWEERFEDESNDTAAASADGDTKRNDSIPAANRNAFFAFSAGARSCPGMKFALQEAVLVLATLLKHLTFTLKPDYKFQPVRNGIVHRPKGGLPMSIAPRKPN